MGVFQMSTYVERHLDFRHTEHGEATIDLVTDSDVSAPYRTQGGGEEFEDVVECGVHVGWDVLVVTRRPAFPFLHCHITLYHESKSVARTFL